MKRGWKIREKSGKEEEGDSAGNGSIQSWAGPPYLAHRVAKNEEETRGLVCLAFQIVKSPPP